MIEDLAGRTAAAADPVDGPPGFATDRGERLGTSDLSLHTAVAELFAQAPAGLPRPAGWTGVLVGHLLNGTIGHEQGSPFRADIGGRDPAELPAYAVGRPRTAAARLGRPAGVRSARDRRVSVAPVRAVRRRRYRPAVAPAGAARPGEPVPRGRNVSRETGLVHRVGSCGDGRFFGDGTDGQYLIVDPARDLAFSTLADEPEMAAIRGCPAPLLA